MKPTKERLDHVSELIEHALDGDPRAQGEIKTEIRNSELEESHSTSDFPAALKTITQAATLEQYAQIESVYTQYTRPYNVNNLRPQAFYSLLVDNTNMVTANGGVPNIVEQPGGLPRIPELTEFPTFSFSASDTSFGVAKYGARVNFSFEMLLNDEWGVLETLPTQLATLARNQEDIVATEVLANVQSPYGPNPTFFNTNNGNILANNPALTVDSLDAAINSIKTRKFNGNPVTVGAMALIVPPALERTARRVTSISEFLVTDTNGTYNIANPVSGVQVIVNPWLPIIDKSASVNTTWYLVPAGSAGIRPAIVFSKIRGRETPELRIASATGEYLGGGSVPGREGSFVNDDIEFRVRHFVGSAGIAPEVVAVSKGTNAA
jgi:hypothetical protein